MPYQSIQSKRCHAMVAKRPASKSVLKRPSWNAAPPKKGLKRMMRRPVGKKVIKRPFNPHLRYTRAKPAARAVTQWIMNQRFVLTCSKSKLVEKLIEVGWIRCANLVARFKQET